MSRYMKIAKLPDSVFLGILDRVCSGTNKVPMYRLCQGGDIHLGDILNEDKGIYRLQRYLAAYKTDPKDKKAIQWLSVSKHTYLNI